MVGFRTVCANFERVRNPLYLILAELHNLKTDLIAHCVYMITITYNTVERNTSPPLSAL